MGTKIMFVCQNEKCDKPLPDNFSERGYICPFCNQELLSWFYYEKDDKEDKDKTRYCFEKEEEKEKRKRLLVERFYGFTQ